MPSCFLERSGTKTGCYAVLLGKISKKEVAGARFELATSGL